MHIEVKLYI